MRNKTALSVSPGLWRKKRCTSQRERAVKSQSGQNLLRLVSRASLSWLESTNVIPRLEGGRRHAHEPLGDLMAGCMYIYGRIWAHLVETHPPTDTPPRERREAQGLLLYAQSSAPQTAAALLCISIWWFYSIALSQPTVGKSYRCTHTHVSRFLSPSVQTRNKGWQMISKLESPHEGGMSAHLFHLKLKPAFRSSQQQNRKRKH